MLRAPDYAELLFISVPFRFNWHLWPGLVVMDILVTLWRPWFHAKTDQPDVIFLPKATCKPNISVVLSLFFFFFLFLFFVSFFVGLLSSSIFTSTRQSQRVRLVTRSIRDQKSLLAIKSEWIRYEGFHWLINVNCARLRQLILRTMKIYYRLQHFWQ